MSSKLLLSDDASIHQTKLPPNITYNPRRKIEAGQVSANEIQLYQKNKADFDHQLVSCNEKPPPVPPPMFPITITWSPNTLYFNLDAEPVVAKLWIWNLCKRSIYIHCCGLWDETARLGASWCCYPRTRFWLPPGLKAEVFIRATPRELSPVPCANAYLQIAAEHMRDNVTAYFSVPIVVNYSNYVRPPLDEVE